MYIWFWKETNHIVVVVDGIFGNFTQSIITLLGCVCVGEF